MSIDYQKFADDHKNPTGAPKSNPITPPARILPVCSKCFSVVGQGKIHQCGKNTKREKISEMIQSTSVKSCSKITAKNLKKLANEEGSSTRGGTLELFTGGTSLPVKIGKSKVEPKQPHFSHENLKRLQTANNLSDRALL